jgi:membrane protein involved in colicin uptake
MALRFSRFSEFWVVTQLKEYTQLEAQLVSERTARQGLEASLWEQKMMTEKIAAESRSAAEKAAAESDKAVKEALERAAMAHANEVNRLLQQCKVKKLI